MMVGNVRVVQVLVNRFFRRLIILSASAPSGFRFSLSVFPSCLDGSSDVLEQFVELNIVEKDKDEDEQHQHDEGGHQFAEFEQHGGEVTAKVTADEDVFRVLDD